MTPSLSRRTFAAAAITLAIAPLGAASAYAQTSAYDFGPATLRLGSRGIYVSTLQKAINERTGARLVADGIFGPGTDTAVRAFQRSVGLTADGIVGSATKNALNATSAPAPAQPTNFYVPDNGHPDYWWGAGQVMGSSIALGRPANGTDLVNGTRLQVIATAMVRQGVIGAVPSDSSLSLSKMLPQVRSFQSRNGLPAHGFIDEPTFAAANRVLGTRYDWRMDGYIQDTHALALGGNAAQRINAMVSFYQFFEYRTPYTWGGMGYIGGPTRQEYHPEIGFDCSGLVYQMVAAGGIVMTSTDPVRHAQESFRSTQAIYNDPRLLAVPLSQVRNGDIVTFADSGGTIRHNAIFYNGYLLEAATSPIRRSVWRGGVVRGNRYPKPYVKRPFI